MTDSSIDRSRVADAIELAAHSHAGQMRKYGGGPFINHPLRVMCRVMRMGLDDGVVAAAVLHDVIEDSSVMYDDLIVRFTPSTASIVLDLTDYQKPDEAPRAVRKRKYRERLSKAWKVSQTIKVVDRIDNLRDMAGAPDDFKELYAAESFAMANVLGKVDKDLLEELRGEATALMRATKCPTS